MWQEKCGGPYTFKYVDRKRNIFFKGMTTWLKVDFSTAALKWQRDRWENISKVLKENNCHLEFYSIRKGPQLTHFNTIQEILPNLDMDWIERLNAL